MGRGLSQLQRDILKVLAENPKGMRGSEIDWAIHRCCPAATSRAIGRLRQRGLVTGFRWKRYRLKSGLVENYVKAISNG